MDELTVPSAESRLTSDTYRVNEFLARGQRLGIRAPSLLIGGVIMMVSMDAHLALVPVSLLPIIALANHKRGKQMFYLFGFVGGVLTFAMPDGIFCNDTYVFPILKSVLQHTGLLLIPIVEYVSGSFRPTLKDLGWVIWGCLVHLANCEGIDRLLGFTGDYMFLRSDLPFVIPGVPQFITLSVFAVILLALLSFLCDIKGSLAFLKSQKIKT
jgi:uncharacterized membrane protein YwaF